MSAPLSATGARLHFQNAASLATGSYNVPLTGTAGTANATTTLGLTVSAGPVPGFSLTTLSASELSVAPGSSGSIQFASTTYLGTDYDITPSVSGLPTGTTATVNPGVFYPGETVTVTVTAAANAPLVQNVLVKLTGTPSISTVNPASAGFYLDVMPPPGSLANSRTDFVATAGTPYVAVYDAAHSLIFASNPSWNRVDVVSNVTHKVVKSIPIRSPRGIDITQDNSVVWVQTGTQNYYAIDTTNFRVTQYALPTHTFGSAGVPLYNGTDRILALKDGTLFFDFNDSASSGAARIGVLDPRTSQLTVLSPVNISAWGIPVRSGDGSKVYAANDTYDTGIEVYDTATRSVTKIGSGTSYGSIGAVNSDGSRFIVAPLTGTPGVYTNTLSPLGTLPGSFEIGPGLVGGVIFSPDGSRIYINGVYNGKAVILTVDGTTLQVLGTAPAAFTDPVGTSGYDGTSAPFALDGAGVLLGIQNFGIGFEDPAFVQNYVPNVSGSNGSTEFIAVFGGPLAGGTTSSLLRTANLTPDVWFNQTRGTTTPPLGGSVSFTSPLSDTPGPVNVKFIFPDGMQWYYPQLFSYSTNPEYAITSGSSPDGGAPARVLGYGMPFDGSTGTVKVGGNPATITTKVGQYPPLSGEPYPSTILAYTFPAGNPGWSDLQVTSQIGSGTLPKSVFYAKSVKDYASSDTFTAVLLDSKRNQVYLAAGDHIDVFSTSSNQFVTSLTPASQGGTKKFVGMALTPDGSQLLVTDLLDGSLAVINPDNPSSTFSIPIVAPYSTSSTCTSGPLYVAAIAGNQAFVATGGLPAMGCSASGTLYIVNLQTHAVAQPSAYSQCGLYASGLSFPNAFSIDASSDGNYLVTGGTPYAGACMYSASTSTYTSLPTDYGFGIAISGDANVLFGGHTLSDIDSNRLGSFAQPIAYYGNSSGLSTELLYPRLNASGSMLYVAYPNWFEVLDVPHGSLRLRFALTETIQANPMPLAIDSGGRFVYLLTDKGLTVVDMGEALLSIGHISQPKTGPGGTVTLRGSGFDASVTATVGGVAATLTVVDENTATLTVPSAASGPEDIVLTRGDGTSYTLESGLTLP